MNDGTVVRGKWAHGAVLGEAMLQWPTGPLYKGGLALLPSGEYAPHGIGSGALRDGVGVFSGRWTAGEPEGDGTLLLPDGTRFDGTVRRGQPDGDGLWR